MVKVPEPPAAGEVQVVLLVSSMKVIVFPLTEMRTATAESMPADLRVAGVLQPVVKFPEFKRIRQAVSVK